MQKTAKGIILFDVTEFTPQMREMADAIVKCAELAKEATAAAAVDQFRGTCDQ